jgi:hypothetical protein
MLLLLQRLLLLLKQLLLLLQTLKCGWIHGSQPVVGVVKLVVRLLLLDAVKLSLLVVLLLNVVVWRMMLRDVKIVLFQFNVVVANNVDRCK